MSKGTVFLWFVFLSFLVILGSSQNLFGSWIRDQNKNKVDDLIDTIYSVYPDSVIDLIVDFGHRPIPDDSTFLSQFGDSAREMKYIHAMSLKNVPVGAVYTIASEYCVTMVELDVEVYMTLDTSAKAVKARPSSMYSPNTAWDEGYRGYGITIGILDTGVDDGHESLDDMDDDSTTIYDSKFVGGYNAFPIWGGERNPNDENWFTFHGTHVAGIALGTGGEDSIYMGVAPEAKLVDVKVLETPLGIGTTDIVERGIQWCIDKRDTAWVGQPPEYWGIDVMNLSLGDRNSCDGKCALCRKVNAAESFGLVVVVAAGNDGSDGRMPSPAAADGAITVGAVSDSSTVDRSDDAWASYSNRGPRESDGDSDPVDEFKPDVVAPGGEAPDSISSANGVPVTQEGEGYHGLCGTSMASPHVAGIAGLILEAHPDFTPQDVKNKLRLTAEDKGDTFNPYLDPKYDVKHGWGLVDAYKAVTVPDTADPWIVEWGDPPGSPPPYKTPDIWLENDPPEVGDTNTIYARVHNTGPEDATGVQVNFYVCYYGAGMSNWDTVGDDTRDVPRYTEVIFETEWVPTNEDHTCLRAEIVYDTDYYQGNNLAQENVRVLEASSRSQVSFRVWNPTNEAEFVALCIDRMDLPSDWEASLTDSLVFLEPGDSTDVMLTINPFSALSDTAAVHVSAIPIGEIYAFDPWGGITVDILPPFYPEFIRGDVDGSGQLTLGDGIQCFRCQFVPGWPDSCRCDDAMDSNDNGSISIGDCLRILRKQFVPGWQDSIPPPCCSAPGDCGPDPTEDALGCEEHPACGTGKGKIVPKQETIGGELIPGKTTIIDHKLILPVYLSASRDLSGFAYNLSYDPSVLCFASLETEGLVTEKFDFISALPGQREVAVGAVVSFDFSQSLPKGKHHVANLVFEVKETDREAMLKFTDAELVDTNCKPLTATLSDAVIKKLIMPRVFALRQASPNPFTEETGIRYQLPTESYVALRIYNASGQLVTTLINGKQKPGYYRVKWDGKDATGMRVSSGVYFYRLMAGKFTDVKKMILLR